MTDRLLGRRKRRSVDFTEARIVCKIAPEGVIDIALRETSAAAERDVLGARPVVFEIAANGPVLDIRIVAENPMRLEEPVVWIGEEVRRVKVKGRQTPIGVFELEVRRRRRICRRMAKA